MDTEPSPAPTPAAAYDPKEEKKKREEEQKRREEQAKYDALPAEKKQVIKAFSYKYFNVYMYCIYPGACREREGKFCLQEKELCRSVRALHESL